MDTTSSITEYLAYWQYRNSNRKKAKLFINGIEIIVYKKVFSPSPDMTNSTNIVLNNLPDLENKKVLDLGCGCGILGLLSQIKKAKFVTAIDNDAFAIKNTRSNFKLLNYGTNYEVINSDLFANVTGKYDYILANLPIWADIYKSNLEQHKLYNSLFKNYRKYLHKNGLLYLTFASFGSRDLLLSFLNEYNIFFDLISDYKFGVKWELFLIKHSS